MYTTRKTCRVCDDGLVPVLDLGMQKLTGWLSDPAQDHPEGPLELTVCTNPLCRLVQLKHTLEPDLMFADQDYGYKSGLNETMKRALEDVVTSTLDKTNYGDKQLIWVDIGANDGTLLKAAYHIDEAYTVGFEPVKKLAGTWEDYEIKEWISDYFTAATYPKDLGRADVITACAMFYDLEDPHAFLHDIKTVLADDGIFVIQLSYLPFMLALNDWPSICHEHLEYYSLRALEFALGFHGLRVFDLELNEVNGGSLRVYVDKRVREPSFMVQALRFWENELKLHTALPYKAFAQRSKANISEIKHTVRNLNKQGHKVFAYTASTKGNVIIQACGLTNKDVPYALERNPLKHGTYCAGSGIEVISEEEGRSYSPDYLLVFPWYFMDEFRRREKDWHDAGGRWIVPLPEVVIE